MTNIIPLPDRRPPQSEPGSAAREAIIGWLENEDWFSFDLASDTWTAEQLADHLLVELGLVGLKVVPVGAGPTT